MALASFLQLLIHFSFALLWKDFYCASPFFRLDHRAASLCCKVWSQLCEDFWLSAFFFLPYGLAADLPQVVLSPVS